MHAKSAIYVRVLFTELGKINDFFFGSKLKKNENSCPLIVKFSFSPISSKIWG